VEAVAEVRDTKAALKELGHILKAFTGAQTLSATTLERQLAPERQKLVHQHEILIHHKGW
jgi:sorbitol-specific phosphotransferase system component IIA